MTSKTTLLIAASGAALALASAANAFIIGDPFITITASNGSGSGSFSVPLASTSPGPNGSQSFSLGAPVNIMSGPNIIATITNITSTVRPQFGATPNTISLSFSFLAGSSTTHFVVDTALLTIDPIIGEAARATAGVTITDSDNDGVTITGPGAAGTLYTTRYNGQAPGGTTFADLLGPLSAGNGQTNSASQNSPVGPGFTPLGNVNDMSARWDFNLTSGDQVGVSSSFFLVPAPGAMALLGLAGLTLGRRSRR